MKEFPQLLGSFLLEYVPRRRNLSANTAKSYRDTFVLLLRWLSEEEEVRPENVKINDLGRDRIEAFCAWLMGAKGVSAATANVRLSALRSFANYVGFTEPAYLEWAAEVRKIKLAKSPPKEVGFLGPEAVGAIIGCADGNLRDFALLSLLYDSGARVSEVSSAVCGDLRLAGPATIRLVGKGSKVRVVPLCEQVAATLERYLATIDTDPASPLFTNRSGGQIGRAGIAWVLSKYSKIAHDANPTLVPEGVHPHMMRHSKAMHLLEAGVNLIYIRDFLGHSSVTTTEIYARASTKAKREAIERAASDVVAVLFYNEEEKSDLIEWLKTLM